MPIPAAAGSEGGDALVPTSLVTADFTRITADVDGAVEAAVEAGLDPGRALADAVLGVLFDAPAATVAALDEADLLTLATAHPLVQRLVGLTEAATPRR